MKILIISNCSPVEYQGSGYVISNFRYGLQQKGHEVELISPDNYEPLQFLRGRANSYRQALGMAFLTLWKLSKTSYDVVEFYGAESWLTLSVIKILWPMRKFLLIGHSNGLETHVIEVMKHYTQLSCKHNKWYHFDQTSLFIKAFTQVDGLVVVSHYDGDYAVEHKYVKPNRLLVIENSLPESFLGLDVDFDREQVIGYCGSWITRKGIELIQSDLTRILTDFPRLCFKLIGVGTSFKKESVFPASICSQIEVIPFVPDKIELRRIYQSLSILIVPSIYESFGLVTVEAMACGCAIVATKTGLAASLRPNEEAIILEKPVSPLLYEGVAKLLLNESLRLQVARAGYERVQNLRWDVAVQSLEKAYQKWLEELRGT